MLTGMHCVCAVWDTKEALLPFVLEKSRALWSDVRFRCDLIIIMTTTSIMTLDVAEVLSNDTNKNKQTHITYILKVWYNLDI